MQNTARRLFIALPINVNDKKVFMPLENAAIRLEKFSSVLKIVSLENFHITIKFLGSVDAATAGNLTSGFSTLSGLNKVRYTIEGIGAFPSADHPSVIWAGINCDKNALSSIVQAVEHFVSGYGFTPEKRKFSPHLTLARIKKGKKIPADLNSFLKQEKINSSAPLVFSELVLFESFLKNTGPEYKKISAIHLD